MRRLERPERAQEEQPDRLGGEAIPSAFFRHFVIGVRVRALCRLQPPHPDDSNRPVLPRQVPQATESGDSPPLFESVARETVSAWKCQPARQLFQEEKGAPAIFKAVDYRTWAVIRFEVEKGRANSFVTGPKPVVPTRNLVRRSPPRVP
jgi:hypothetical protein